MFCPNCGSQIPDTVQFCGECGHRFEAAISPTQEQPSSAPPVISQPPVQRPAPAPKQAMQSPKTGLPGWVWGAVGGLGIVMVLGIFFLFKPDSPQQVVPTQISQPAQQQPTEAPAQSQTVAAPKNTAQPGSQLPSQVTDVLANAKVYEEETFKSLSDEKWWHAEQKVDVFSDGDGLLKLTGGEQPLWTYIIRSRPLEEGQATLIRFRYDGPLLVFESQFDLGDWETSSYKRFGIAQWDKNKILANIWDGTQNSDRELSGALSFDKGEWFYLLLAVGPDADFILRLWQEDNSANMLEHRQAFGSSWYNQEWYFSTKIGKGTFYLDNYTGISFSGYR